MYLVLFVLSLSILSFCPSFLANLYSLYLRSSDRFVLSCVWPLFTYLSIFCVHLGLLLVYVLLFSLQALCCVSSSGSVTFFSVLGFTLPQDGSVKC